mmetsp:Transcript_11210/g.31189  ORF Transcript_11210/g.31189 Transcript_11210/m.31189 type:complete len:226 (+) Transcript_11210:549-1226(+)
MFRQLSSHLTFHNIDLLQLLRIPAALCCRRGIEPRNCGLQKITYPFLVGRATDLFELLTVSTRERGTLKSRFGKTCSRRKLKLVLTRLKGRRGWAGQGQVPICRHRWDSIGSATLCAVDRAMWCTNVNSVLTCQPPSRSLLLALAMFWVHSLCCLMAQSQKLANALRGGKAVIQKIHRRAPQGQPPQIWLGNGTFGDTGLPGATLKSTSTWTRTATPGQKLRPAA